MSFRTSGHGEITLNGKLSGKDICKLYAPGEIEGSISMDGQGFFVFNAHNLASVIASLDDAFLDINVITSDPPKVELTVGENCDDEALWKTLKRFEPIAVDGRIDIRNEADGHWTYRLVNGAFVEYEGHVVYDCDREPAANQNGVSDPYSDMTVDAPCRTVTFGMEWTMYGRQTVELDDDVDAHDPFEIREYLESIWDEIPLPTDGDYVPGSDVLSSDISFEVYDPEEIDK